MRPSSPMASVTIARTAWGTVLTAAPGAVLRRCPRTPAGTVLRLLGIRHVVQGLATPAELVPAGWTVVPDALHATTMAGLALCGGRWRTGRVRGSRRRRGLHGGRAAQPGRAEAVRGGPLLPGQRCCTPCERTFGEKGGTSRRRPSSGSALRAGRTDRDAWRSASRRTGRFLAEQPGNPTAHG